MNDMIGKETSLKYLKSLKTNCNIMMFDFSLFDT
jgi:hypothetical protein